MRNKAYRERLNSFPLVLCLQLGFWGLGWAYERKWGWVEIRV